MKPIKLVMSAFGPYGDLAPAIEFESMEEKGLFLISGDTGSGKTTIFDAICFALFGTTSGSYRDTKNLRSEYAKDQTESFVEFTFSHQGKTYVVKRSPQYERQKLRGTGVVSVKEQASLACDGELPLDGLSTVNNRIKEFLNLDEKQFKQIAMIAQGEFWNLLNAKTEERTKILRSIFMTSGYRNMEDRLRAYQTESGIQLDTAGKSIVQYFCDVKCALDSTHKDALEQMQTRAKESMSAWNVEDFLQLTDLILEEDTDEADHLAEQLEEEVKELEKLKVILATAENNNALIKRREDLEKQQEELELRRDEICDLEALATRQKDATHIVDPLYRSWIGKMGEIGSAKRQMKTLNAELEETLQNVQDAKNTLDKEQAKEPVELELRRKIQRIEDDKEKYGKRDQLLFKEQELKRSWVKLEERKTGWDTKNQKLESQLTEWSSFISDHENIPVQLLEVIHKGQDYAELQTHISELLEKRIPAYLEREQAYKKAQNAFQSARCVFQASQDVMHKKEQLLENSRAGLLAMNLEEGTPCPVCGSTHHPQTAELPAVIVTEEELKDLKHEVEAHRQEKEKRLSDAEGKRGAYLEYKEQLYRDMIECLTSQICPILDADSIDKTDDPAQTEAMEALLHVLTKQAKTLEAAMHENKDTQQKLQALCDELALVRKHYEKGTTTDREQLRLEKEQLDQDKEHYNEEVVACRTQLSDMELLPYENWKTAFAAQQKLQNEADAMKHSRNTAEKNYRDLDKSAVELRAAIKTTDENLITLMRQEQECHQNYLETRISKGFTDDDMFLVCVVPEKVIDDQDRLISDYKQQVHTVKQQLKQAIADAKDLVMTDVSALQQQVEEKQSQVNTLRSCNNEYQNRIQHNKDRKLKISTQTGDLENLYKKYHMCTRLYELVRGTTRNGKITLEQYIQANGFDTIIHAANRRLLPMSGGQYELYRQESSVSKKSNTFLDLEVLDNFTGKRRPVGNLSGGESFKASLSLALGLSDTVSSHLGGIQMDALFIDEGFGTLDRKSIDSAMEVLTGLSNANKLVGVISHREELMENIPQQIRVTKTKDGSHIEIENGL